MEKKRGHPPFIQQQVTKARKGVWLLTLALGRVSASYQGKMPPLS